MGQEDDVVCQHGNEDSADLRRKQAHLNFAALHEARQAARKQNSARCALQFDYEYYHSTAVLFKYLGMMPLYRGTKGLLTYAAFRPPLVGRVCVFRLSMWVIGRRDSGQACSFLLSHLVPLVSLEILLLYCLSYRSRDILVRNCCCGVPPYHSS